MRLFIRPYVARWPIRPSAPIRHIRHIRPCYGMQ